MSSSCDRMNTRPTARDANVLRTARVGPFHVSTDLRKAQNDFAPFVVGPSVDDRLPEANRTYIRHHQKKRSGCSVLTSMGGQSVARAWWILRRGRSGWRLFAPDRRWSLLRFLAPRRIDIHRSRSQSNIIGKGTPSTVEGSFRRDGDPHLESGFFCFRASIGKLDQEGPENPVGPIELVCM